MDLLVMENVFYERSLAPVYDLKGSERARWCKDDPADPTTVLLDENLKRDILSAPLLVRRPALSGASPLRKRHLCSVVAHARIQSAALHACGVLELLWVDVSAAHEALVKALSAETTYPAGYRVHEWQHSVVQGLRAGLMHRWSRPHTRP